MTGPDDSHSNTRPISVAELLAKNGTIGAPPVGGRRRRRRGNSDAVSVAELTGEIPIVTGHDHDDQPAGHHADDHDADDDHRDDHDRDDHDRDDHDEPVTSRQTVIADHHPQPTGPVPTTNGAGAHLSEVTAQPAAGFEPASAPAEDHLDDDHAGAAADYDAHIQQRDTDVDPVDFFAPPRRPQYAPGKRRFGPMGRGAEQMSPDPIDEDDGHLDAPGDLADEPEIEDVDTQAAVGDRHGDALPSYLRATSGTLFGGQTVADDLARRGVPARPETTDVTDARDRPHTDAAPEGMSSILRGAWVVGQCIIAVAFGAGLFIAFDQLWKWNNIVALVLSVLVILGLVVGVRVVRKTEDIGSTLIAVAVGALVTLGPLALLQSG
jgi:hypothetical protein